MTFSEVLNFMMEDQSILVTREAWRDKICIALRRGYPDGITCNKKLSDLYHFNIGDPIIIKPFFQALKEDGSLEHYTPTTEDILSYDWYIEEQEEL